MAVKVRIGNQWIPVSGGGGEAIGTISVWSGASSNLPDGYLLCDGSAISRTTYVALFTAIGTTNGVGDGSSTFNIPDLRNKFVVGASDSTGDTTYPGLSPGSGSVGGSPDAVIVSHRHTTDNYVGRSNYAEPRNFGVGTDGNLNSTGTTGDAQSISDPISTIGESATNKNLPPYYALCYIIKVFNSRASTTGGGGSGGSGFVLLTEKTATGTSVEFDGIPSDALEITLMLDQVSLSGNDQHYKIQLGTSSGYITSGYDSLTQSEAGGSEITANDCFILRAGNAAYDKQGLMLIKKASGTSYVQTGQFANQPHQGGNQTYGSLSSVSGTVDRLRIILSGSDTFDAGKMNVSYKTSGSGSGSGGGGGITIQEEGTSLPTLATTLNFVGAAVTATGTGSNKTISISTPNVTTGTTKVAILKDKKDPTVYAGTFTLGGWRDRDLTIQEGTSDFVTFTAGGSQSSGSAGNTPGYWSLPAGTYRIDWSAPGNDVNRHKTRLVYSTTQSQISTAGLDASASFVEGSSENTSSSASNNPIQTVSVGFKIITLTQTTWFKILHYCTETQNDSGFGSRFSSTSGFGSSIYTQVRIEDLATAIKQEHYSGGGTVGEVVAWSGLMADVNIPSGYFVCDGRSLNKNTYASLFAVIGYIHGGSGDDFNVPNLKDKFIVGATNSTGDTTYPGVSPAATGGSANAIVVSHSHTVKTGQSDDGSNAVVKYVSDASDVANSSLVNEAGSSATNANLPPYYALAYIINATGQGAIGGASGSDKQVQFNDGGSTLAGADGLEFHKWISGSDAPTLRLKPASGDSDTYGGGNIMAQTKNDGNGVPYSRTKIRADGGLEIMRRRVVNPMGGPYIDFSSQLDSTNAEQTDFDARIQMDYTNGFVSGQAIDPSNAEYSAITFQTGGGSYYDASNNTTGRVIERLRIGKAGEIGILAGHKIGNGDVDNTRTNVQKYGNAGEVLTSNGFGNSVSWTPKGTPSGSSFTTGLQVNIPATQPGLNLGDTVNIANFNSNTSANTSKLLIYNVRKVAASSWENTAMIIQRQIDSTNFGYIQFGDGDGNQTNGGTLCFGNSAERLKITADGRIGINYSSPNDYELDIMKRSTATNAQIRLYNNETGVSNDTIIRSQIGGTSASNYIYFGDSDDSNAGQIRYQHGNDSMQFFAGASERLQITATGNVLCNSSTPAYFGLPRVTTAEKGNLTGMSGGALVYDTDLHGVFWYDDNTNSWRAI